MGDNSDVCAVIFLKHYTDMGDNSDVCAVIFLYLYGNY